MSVIRKDRLFRFSLIIVLLGMLICVCMLVFGIPDIDRIELIPVSKKTVAVRHLLPEEELV